MVFDGSCSSQADLYLLRSLSHKLHTFRPPTTPPHTSILSTLPLTPLQPPQLRVEVLLLARHHGGHGLCLLELQEGLVALARTVSGRAALLDLLNLGVQGVGLQKQ